MAPTTPPPRPFEVMTLVPTSYAEVALFMMLAVGAALFLGTGAALLRYRRTGLFPGETGDEEAAGSETDRLGGDHGDGGRPGASRAQVRAAFVKCGIGAVLMVWALGTIIVQRGS